MSLLYYLNKRVHLVPCGDKRIKGLASRTSSALSLMCLWYFFIDASHVSLPQVSSRPSQPGIMNWSSTKEQYNLLQSVTDVASDMKSAQMKRGHVMLLLMTATDGNL